MDIKELINNFIEKGIKPNTFCKSSMIKELVCEHLIYEHNINADWNGLTIYIDNKPICRIRTGKEHLQGGEGSIVYFDGIRWLI